MSRYSFWEVVASIAEDKRYSEEYINEVLESSLKKNENMPKRKAIKAKVRQHLCTGPISRLLWTWIIMGLHFHKDDQKHSDFTILDLPNLVTTEGIEIDENSLQTFLHLHNLPLPESIFGKAEAGKTGPVTLSVPHGTTWDQINIRIANDQRVEIKYPGRPMEPWRPEDIGFANKRLLWPLFKQLAIADGELKPKDFKSIKANISNIRNILKNLFPSIKGAPIKDYSREHGFVCNFQISMASHLYDHHMGDDEVEKFSRKATPSKKTETTPVDYEKILAKEGLSEKDLKVQEEEYQDLMEGFKNER